MRAMMHIGSLTSVPAASRDLTLMLHDAEVQNAQWERKVTADIHHHCEQIQRDADIPNFVETLCG